MTMTAMMGTLVVVLPGAANQEKYPSNEPSPHLFVSAVSPPVIIPSSADCSLQSPARQPNLVTGTGYAPGTLDRVHTFLLIRTIHLSSLYTHSLR